MKKTRVGVAAVSSFALIVMLASCASDPDAAGPKTDRVVLAVGDEPDSLDPHRSEADDVFEIGLAVYDRLMTRDNDGELVPSLAVEEPTQVDDLTWRFSIKEGVTFTDGTDLTSADVVSSVERILSPDVNSQWLSTLGGITGATAVDDYTVDITTEAPSPLVPAQTFFIAIVPEETGLEDIGDKLVGSGPYALDEWKRGQYIDLVRNDDYAGDKPVMASARYVAVETPATRVSGLLSGEYDFITDISVQDADRVPQAIQVDGTAIRGVRYSAQDGITGDARVREAMTLAIDTETIISQVFDDAATPMTCQLLTPEWTGFNPDLKASPYDPERAKQLISEAGAEGAQVTLASMGDMYLREREYVQVIVKAWQDAGLDAKAEFLSPTAYYEAVFDKNPAPGGFSFEHTNPMADADRTLTLFYAPGSGVSTNSFTELDGLVAEARTTLDETARQALNDQVTQLACDENLFYFGVRPDVFYGLSEGLSYTPRKDLLRTPMNFAPAE